MEKGGWLRMGILFVTSLSCIRRCPWYMRYARSCYKLHAITAFLGFLHFGPQQIKRIQPIFQVLWVWTRCLGLPLIAAQMTSTVGLQTEVAPLQLALPTYALIQYHNAEDQFHSTFLTVSHTNSILSLILINVFIRSRTLAAYALLQTFVTVWFDMCCDTNDSEMVEVWCVLMCASNYLSIKYLSED